MILIEYCGESSSLGLDAEAVLFSTYDLAERSVEEMKAYLNSARETITQNLESLRTINEEHDESQYFKKLRETLEKAETNDG